MKEIGERVFNTGKVQIGASYHPIKVKPMTYDAEQIQKIFLKEYIPKTRTPMAHKAIYVSLISAVFIVGTLM
jgi:hypothetical protein